MLRLDALRGLSISHQLLPVLLAHYVPAIPVAIMKEDHDDGSLGKNFPQRSMIFPEKVDQGTSIIFLRRKTLILG